MTKKWIKIVEETISEKPNTHKLKEILEIAVIKYKKTFKIKIKTKKEKTIIIIFILVYVFYNYQSNKSQHHSTQASNASTI